MLVDPRELEASKRELRRLARSEVLVDREALAARCLEQLVRLPQLVGPGTVALYASVGDEVPVERCAPQLRVRGWRILFPRVRALDLELCEALPSELVTSRNHAGLREPPWGRPVVPVAHVDVFVVPGLLFAQSGTRLGRGSGHYDRLLRRARPDAVRIGICYADRVRDALPSAPHDIPVEFVVTDQAVLQCPAAAGPEDLS